MFPKSDISPYLLTQDALNLIQSMTSTLEPEKEHKIIVLLNVAENDPHMSRYQLSLAHKAFGDCYYLFGILQSALLQYEIAIGINRNLSIKKRIKELNAVPIQERLLSISPDIVDDITQYPEYRKNPHEVTVSLSANLLENSARRKMYAEVLEDNKVLDSGFDEEIAERLSRLPLYYQEEFYRIKDTRNDPYSLLSNKKLDLLNLEAMEKSARFRSEISNSRELIDELKKNLSE